jgi:OmpA-OmpF porin, OOP family
MRRQLRLGRPFIVGAVISAGLAALSPAAADVITVDDGALPEPIDIPFTCALGADNELWLPSMGFVYRNIEPFELIPGDTIAFDIQMRAGAPPDLGFLPQLDIALAHVSNPLMPFKPDDLAGSDFTLVANDAVAASAGNRVVQDYELAFTVDKSFHFPGGGLIIRVTEPRGVLATRNFMSCLRVITSDRQPSGTNRLVGTFVNEAGEYPWVVENTVASPFVPYVRISWTRCGDGRVSGAETCDDGNTDDLDECTNRCVVAACGDGLLQRAEQCDNSATPDKADPYCNDKCVLGAVAKGSGCDAGQGVGGAAALLLLAALVRRRRAAAAGASMALLCWTSAAHAQMKTDGFRVDRFEMAPSVDDGLVLQDPSVLPNMVWSASATVGLTNTVLRVVPEVSSDTGVDVVGPRLSAYLDFALGLRDRFEVNVSLPFAVAQSTESGMAAGYTLRDAGTSAVGDGRVGGSVLLYGHRTGFQLGLATTLTVPLGSERSFTGDGGLGGEAQVMAGMAAPRYRLLINGGVRLRPEADYVTSDQGTEFIGRVGVIVPFAKKRLNTSVELDVIGRANGGDAYRELGTPVLALLGARYHFANGVRAGVGIGAGLTEAPGSPAVRTLITVGYSPEPKKPGPPRPRDTDRDTIDDPHDRCPTIPEDFNGIEDSDGCPEGDHDVIVDHQPDPLTLEQVITLPAPIEFEFDTAIMLPGAETYLLQVLQVLKQHPEVRKLEIQGHTSSEGGPEYNLRLSNARATAVYNWLVERGIEPTRLVPHGYGLTQPLAPNDSEPNRQRNRRVQFRLLEKDPDPAPATTPAINNPSPTTILQPIPPSQTTTTLHQGPPAAAAGTSPTTPTVPAPAKPSVTPTPTAPTPAKPGVTPVTPAKPATPTFTPAKPATPAPSASPATAPAR